MQAAAKRFISNACYVETQRPVKVDVHYLDFGNRTRLKSIALVFHDQAAPVTLGPFRCSASACGRLVVHFRS